MNKKLLAVSAGVALSTLTVAPALAYDIDSVYWDMSSYSLDEVEDNSSNLNDAYGLDDTSFTMSLHGDTTTDTFGCDPGDTDTTELDGDVLVACDETYDSAITGLQWTGSNKVFSGDFDGLLARQVVTVTNTSNAAIVIDYEYHVDSEECDSGDGNIGTQSGDLTTETSDQWLACNNDNDALEGVAYGVNQSVTGNQSFYDGATVLDDAIGESGADDIYMWNADGLSIAAGQTVNFVYFYRSTGAAEHGSSATGAETDAVFNAFMSDNFDDVTALLADTRLFEDVTGPVANWEEVDAPQALAETGVDASGIALGGALALAAGTAVAIRRRRRA